MRPDGPPVTFTEISQLSLCELVRFKMMRCVKGGGYVLEISPHLLLNTDPKSAIVYVKIEWASRGQVDFYTSKCV